MDRRRRIATWVVAVFAVVGLVAPLAMAFASAVGGGDDADDPAGAIGNDVGRPRPVTPDGELYAGIEPNACTLADIKATSVVEIDDLDDPIRAVRELGAPRLFDVWSTTTATLTPPSRAVGGPIDRLWVDAGTDLPVVLDERQIVFGVIVGDDDSGDLYVLAVAEERSETLEFEWPCPDVLDAEFAALAAEVARSPDTAFAIELLLRE